MNRQTKRLLARQQAAQERAGKGAAPTRPGAAAGPPGLGGDKRKKRTPPRQFLREVRAELKKVAWPTRGEVTTYTVVVLVSVTFVTVLVFFLDLGFAKGVLKVFSR
jgi:preprotein translocase subunit SecE